ncbi:gp53-like domain-containing protein [Pseudescherichia vulneris]
MANTNNFKAFALDPNANVMSQADWEGLPALLSGFTAGKASSAQVNKAIRQATTIGALVGQFIANSGVDALDNGDVAGLVTKFTNAITTNLGLGTAATKNVGTGTGQIPDMGSFSNSLAVSGYQKLPGGLIIQWGSFNVSATSGVGTTDVTFPLAFPLSMRGLSGIMSTNDPSQRFIGFDIATTTKTKARFTYVTPTANSIYWIATGN